MNLVDPTKSSMVGLNKSILQTGNFTINGRQGIGTYASDPQRTYNWDLTIPQDLINRVKKVAAKRGQTGRPLANIPNAPTIPTISNEANKILVEEDLIIKCKSATIPNKAFDEISTSFFGHKKMFPSKVAYSNSVDVEYEENERQTIKRFFDDWQWAIYNADFYSGEEVGNSSYSRDQFTTKIQLAFYGYNGIGLDKNIQFINAWPKEVKDSGVTYNGGSETVKYSVSFTYDFWEFGANSLVKIPGGLI
jgi:hypothetical protein